MRYKLIVLIALLPAAAACGGEASSAPNVTGMRLDVAQARLEDDGLSYEVIGRGALGPSYWWVCKQRPRPGNRTEPLRLIVARSCRSGDSRVAPDVRGLHLDEAKDELAEAGIGFAVYEEGAGEVRVESLWTVCDQYPSPGETTTEVELHVEHFCDEEYDDDD